MSGFRRSKRNKRTTDHFAFGTEDDNERPKKVVKANAPIIELSSDDDDDEEERKPTASKVTTKSFKKEPTTKSSNAKAASNAKASATSAAATKYQAGALFAVRNVDYNAGKLENLIKTGTNSVETKTSASGLRQAEDESSRKPDASIETTTVTKPAAKQAQSKDSSQAKPKESVPTGMIIKVKPKEAVAKPSEKPKLADTSTEAKSKAILTEPAEKTTKAGTTVQAQPKEATAVNELVKPAPMAAEAPFAAYDSDEEPPKDDPQESLHWRGDPTLTLSDWTIEIVSGGVTDIYYVHKVILSYGARKSKYFLNLFCRGGRYTELESNTSRIELDGLAAKAFPQLLDFVYKTDGKEALEINTDTACALHFLGSYFEMPHLRWEAKHFWKKDLCLANATTYFQHARVFHDDKILDSVAEVFAKNIMDVQPSSTIMEISDAQFWASVVATIDFDAPEPNEKVADGQKTDEMAAAVLKPGEASAGVPETDKSLLQHQLSELIAQFAMDHVDELDLATFRALTAPEKFPIINKKAAMSLMKVEEAITSKTKEKGSLILRDRCVAAIASDWRNMGGMVESSFKKMKRPFLAKLLEKSLENASNDFQKMNKSKTDDLNKAIKAKEDSDKAHEKKISQLKEKLSDTKVDRNNYFRWWNQDRDALRLVSADLAAAELELAQLRSLVPEIMRPQPYNKKSKS